MSESTAMMPANMNALLQGARNIDANLQSSTAGYFVRLYAGFYTICALATLWVFFLARPVRPGLVRALVCLPVVLLQLVATPYLVDRERTAALVVPTMGILSLSAFKVGSSQACALQQFYVSAAC